MTARAFANPDPSLAEAFRRRPFGPHGPELQRLLWAMRGPPLEGKYVLLCTKPHREWVLGRLTGTAEEPIERVAGHVFADLATAEWEVFKLRWRGLTGRAPEDPS